MYCSGLPRVVFNTRRNTTILQTRNYFFLPKSWTFGEKFQTGIFTLYSTFIRNVSASNTMALHNNYLGLNYGSKFFHTRASLLRCIKRGVQKFPLSLKEHSVHIVRVCTQQCECVLAHRIRRGQQIFSLYSKLWDEVALKELMKKMRHQLSRRGKEFLMGAVGVSLYNWEKERITDEEVFGHLNELEVVYELRDCTTTCSQCRRRVVIDAPLPAVDYCKCPTRCPDKAFCGWKPFLEREDLLVWRKEDEVKQGLYVYKVYGAYHEVAAEDFLKVQIDTEVRKVWDSTAINLRIVEQDKKSNSDVVYWEMQWPRMFANRDYVFNRRCLIDRENNVIVVISKGTEHPGVPNNPQAHRVKDYWSFMVIKAYNNIDEPGMEFSLTYFDNPGVTLPSSIAAWVALTGLPDFQKRLRKAATDYRDHKIGKQFKPHTEESGSKIRTDSGSFGETHPEPQWNPSDDDFGGFDMKPENVPEDSSPEVLGNARPESDEKENTSKESFGETDVKPMDAPSKTPPETLSGTTPKSDENKEPSKDNVGEQDVKPKNSSAEPPSVQDYHPTNSSTSRTYLNPWQLFV
ncbi:stAR-related lipid transfer protein 7, mitochondrial-like [Periplaneta americana]|uniref:stAR-related lipid transfer protein 7, mitochondrial-like n=1 Tax=Periplaneta americana TaxID=6978 RepID=UPI0037E96F2F